MEVRALLWHYGAGHAHRVDLASFHPGPDPPRPIQVVPAAPTLAPLAREAEQAMMAARDLLLRRRHATAMGPFLFYLDLDPRPPAVGHAASFGLAAALAFAAHVCRNLRAARVAATGAADLRGNIGRVEHAAEKTQAALELRDATGNLVFGPGDIVFYPAANERDIRAAGLHVAARARGVELVAVRTVSEVLDKVVDIEFMRQCWQGLSQSGRRLAERFAASLGRVVEALSPPLLTLLLCLLYPVFLYPWPWQPSVAVTSPALAREASWQDPALAAWLERPQGTGGPQGKDALYLLEGRLRYPLRYAVFPGRLRLEVVVVTAGGTYRQPDAPLRPWLQRFRAGVWLDRRLPDANLRLTLRYGEKKLAAWETGFRDAPPAPQWSVSTREGLLEVGYRRAGSFLQMAALHLDSGALRLTYLPDGGWGTALYPFAWWEGGRFVRGAQVLALQGQPLFRAAADRHDPRNLRLRLVLQEADWEIVFYPPEEGRTRAKCRLRLLRMPDVGARPMPGEAFQLVHLASMYFDSSCWDASQALVWAGGGGEAPHRAGLANPRAGRFLFASPVEAGAIALEGGTSAWKERAPTVEVHLEQPARAQANGWVSPAQDPDQENVALWAGPEKPLASWQYAVFAGRAAGSGPREEPSGQGASLEPQAWKGEPEKSPSRQPGEPPEPSPPEPAPRSTLMGEITSPRAGETAPPRVTVQGRVSGAPVAGQYLWLAVHPHASPGLWWPQGEPLAWSPDGTWRATVWLGGERDRGEPFDIALWLVGEEINQRLRDYMQRGQRMNDYPGLPLPAGTTVLATVTVQRQ
ncbi:MAG: hypothetical protein ACUVTQ_11035 [Desulfotomaculales bacterium]